MGTQRESLEHARAVADAVLYEGYVLHPGHNPAPRNQVRWQRGVLVPPSYAATGSAEPTCCRTECLAEVDAGARLSLHVRFLQAQRRTVEVGGPGSYREVDSLRIAGEELPAMDEAVSNEQQVTLALDDLFDRTHVVPFTVRGGERTSAVPGGRVVRRKQPLNAELRCHAEALPGLVRVRVVLANTSPVDCSQHRRFEALRHSLVATHLLLSLDGGVFLSCDQPPRWAAEHAHGCVNEHTWPVLVGEPGRRDTMLSAPIALPDYPDAAGGVRAGCFGAHETAPLSDLPKATAGMHPRPAPRQPGTEVADLPQQRTDSARDTVVVGGVEIGEGSRVVLRPAPGCDAQDMFVAGRTATVRALRQDVDGTWFLAVTVDGDPATELLAEDERYRYFTTAEVEPLVEEPR
ncbi:hypothetical protein SacmaDRAFT_1136 [Saccharomonospora marina XMU15]|uniref:Uncharacterized protein n=1 Tax=Saccharomonospora marina XMU15 TaxID=882083 RepID=H5WWD7_9PSEU|nr:hypothetical protein [Saccharomonospora marina]EHR49419.1 hypothetical protein SacmaDRAFT_1136 [Saccharomonospora marina XMU15]